MKIKPIHAHVTYNCKKVSENLFAYKYCITAWNRNLNNSFNAMFGEREFKNHSDFIKHCRNHIKVFYEKQAFIVQTGIIISDYCLSLEIN